MTKKFFKMSKEELELYLYFKKRGFVKQNKKGKGSYKRKKDYLIEQSFQLVRLTY